MAIGKIQESGQRRSQDVSGCNGHDLTEEQHRGFRWQKTSSKESSILAEDYVQGKHWHTSISSKSFGSCLPK
jgi:hypothetical protein